MYNIISFPLLNYSCVLPKKKKNTPVGPPRYEINFWLPKIKDTQMHLSFLLWGHHIRHKAGKKAHPCTSPVQELSTYLPSLWAPHGKVPTKGGCQFQLKRKKQGTSVLWSSKRKDSYKSILCFQSCARLHRINFFLK